MGAAGADPRKVVAAVVQAGYQGSFMEAKAFDQLENEPIRKSISAVQLIADAVTAGIPVYHVTPDNARTMGVELLADWVNEPEHTVIMIVDAARQEQAESFAAPFGMNGSVSVKMGATCEATARQCLGEA